jgi:hypothetical protein
MEIGSRFVCLNFKRLQATHRDASSIRTQPNPAYPGEFFRGLQSRAHKSRKRVPDLIKSLPLKEPRRNGRAMDASS